MTFLHSQNVKEVGGKTIKVPPFVKGREHEGRNVKITFYFFTFAECQKSKAGSYTYRYAYRVQTENKQKDV